MNFSIPVYIQYLEQTYYDHPENICVYDTVLKGQELKVISFTNPDGIAWPDTLISDEHIKDARWPLIYNIKKWG